jgi:hypothetical protein
VTRPGGLIDPWARRINLEDLARLLHDRHRGHDRRVKVRDLGAAILGVVPKHGSAQEVALREAVSKLGKPAYRSAANRAPRVGSGGSTMSTSAVAC